MEKKAKVSVSWLGDDPDLAVFDIFKDFQKSSKQQNSEFAAQFGNNTIEPPLQFFDLAHFVLNNTWHARCVEVSAAAATYSGWSAVPREETSGEDQTKKIEEILEGLVSQSKNHADFACFLYCLAYDLKNFGNAYVEVVRNGRGDPIELYHVPAMTVRLRRTTEEYPQGGFWQMAELSRQRDASTWTGEDHSTPRPVVQSFSLLAGGCFRKTFFKNYRDENEYFLDGERAEGVPEEKNRASEIIHIKNYNPLSPFYGVPGYVCAISAMLGDEAAEKWNLGFFENNRIPRWVIKMTGADIPDRAKEEIKTYFLKLLKARSHVPMIIAVDDERCQIEFVKVETDENEGSFLAYRDRLRDEIIAAHGVPPRMLGVIPSGKLGGKGDAAKQREDFKNFVVRPLQALLAGIFNQYILPDLGFKDYRLELRAFDVEDAEEHEKKVRAATGLVTLGIVTPNEARQMVGVAVSSEEWMDKYFLINGETIREVTEEFLEKEQEERQEERSDEHKTKTSLARAKKLLGKQLEGGFGNA